MLRRLLILAASGSSWSSAAGRSCSSARLEPPTPPRPTEYSEPSAMRALAIADGVKPTDIAVDYGGRRSWDSCYRAKQVFEVERAIVVTNDFHRARTVVVGGARNAWCGAPDLPPSRARTGSSTARAPMRR